MFRDLLQEIVTINESVALARKLYLNTNKIMKDYFDKLVALDPTQQKKYIEWMVKTFINSHYRDNDIEKYNIIAEFDKLLGKDIIPTDKRDINSFSNIEGVDDLVRQFSEIETKSGTIKKMKLEEVDVIFENDKVVVIKPKSIKSSCMYGAHTKWCTSATSSSNYFSDYYFKNLTTLYYIIPKGKYLDKYDKIAISVDKSGTKRYWDVHDKSRTEDWFNKIAEDLGIPHG